MLGHQLGPRIISEESAVSNTFSSRYRVFPLGCARRVAKLCRWNVCIVSRPYGSAVARIPASIVGHLDQVKSGVQLAGPLAIVVLVDAPLGLPEIDRKILIWTYTTTCELCAAAGSGLYR